MKILVAVDGSAYTKRMLAYIAAHDEWLGARHAYTVIHSVLAVSSRAASFIDAADVASYQEEEADVVFDPVKAFFKQQAIEATYVYTVGHAAVSIADLAAEGRFDLLMMGSRGHGDLLNLILGSVATKVIALTKIPVLLIR